MNYRLHCSGIQEHHGWTTLAVQENKGREETMFFNFNLYALGFSRSSQEKYTEKNKEHLG